MPFRSSSQPFHNDLIAESHENTSLMSLIFVKMDINYLMDKWRITDLNRWPLRCDRSALPTELIPQNLCQVKSNITH